LEAGTEQMVIGAAIGAILGILFGYFVGRRTAPSSEQTRELEQKLEATLADGRRFEERVSEHFALSAEKFNQLTVQYREIHQHLASGAETLVREGAGKAFAGLEAPSQEVPAIESDEVVMEPPRDYAPKSSPDDPGVLNESFGIEREDAPPHSSDGPKQQQT
jgi:uncharacterized membrane-anchored protein YhcB (DUF1043 family)